MASNLVVEDGTGLANASSYTSAADIRAYALARGIVLAPGDGDGDLIVDQMAVKAMDYIEANRQDFHGRRLVKTQRLSFPREGVPDVDGSCVGTTTVNGYENLSLPLYGMRDPAPLPPELIEAQCQLVMQVKAGVDLMPTQVSGKFIKREKLGPLEREFSEAVGVYTLPQMPAVNSLLEGLIKPRSSFAFRR